jgi:hypothetical protein
MSGTTNYQSQRGK